MPRADPSSRVAEAGGGGSDQFLLHADEDRLEQCLFIREVVIQRTAGDRGGGHDLFGPGLVVALRHEELTRSGDQRGARRRGLGGAAFLRAQDFVGLGHS